MMGKAQFSLEPNRNLSFIAWITAMQNRTAATLTEKISLVLLPPHPCFHTHFFDLFQCCQLFSLHTHTVPIFESTTVDVLSSFIIWQYLFRLVKRWSKTTCLCQISYLYVAKSKAICQIYSRNDLLNIWRVLRTPFYQFTGYSFISLQLEYPTWAFSLWVLLLHGLRQNSTQIMFGNTVYCSSSTSTTS